MATAQHARLAGHAMRLGRGVGPWPERSAVGVLRKPLRALRHVLICKRLWALMHMCGSSHYGRCSPLRSTGFACGLGALNLLSQWKNRKPRLGVAARDRIDGASRVAACTGGDRATHVLAECAHSLEKTAARRRCSDALLRLWAWLRWAKALWRIGNGRLRRLSAEQVNCSAAPPWTTSVGSLIFGKR
jgi:hypothetical protein